MRTLLFGKAKKRMLGAVLAASVLGVCAAGAPWAGAEETAGHVTFTVEKFTLGQGYVVEPVETAFTAEDTVASLMDKVLGADHYKAPDGAWGKYLTSIRDEGEAPLQIPAYIQKAVTDGGETIDTSGVAEKGWLGQADYTGQAGWLFMVNNTAPQTSMWDTKPQDGDVIRLCFSVWGYGADFMDTGYGEPLAVFANLDAASAKLAAFQAAADREQQLAKPEVKAARDALVAAVTDLTSSQNTVDHALTAFRRALGELPPAASAGEETQAAPSTSVSATTSPAAASTAAPSDKAPPTGESAALAGVCLLAAGAALLGFLARRRRT